MSTELVVKINSSFQALTLIERLQSIDMSNAVFTTSFGLEDQVLLHYLAQLSHKPTITTLDTGRLFPQTYEVWGNSEARYKLKVTPFYPQAAQTEQYVIKNGINGFYDSVEQRKACCFVRKVEPLNRALTDKTIWITGLRGNASDARSNLNFAEIDEARGILKVNPLIDFTREDLALIAQNQVIPVNSLHAQGFLSIGCAPCTRAIETGEDERAGRWWWEQTSKECGLHTGAKS